MKFFPFLLLCLLGVQTAHSQILEIPFSSNPILKIESKKLKNQPNGTDKNGGADTLDLPFLDDFSYDGPYPSSDFWKDRFAFVNTGLPLRPPTTGVATLDALSFDGSAYGNSGTGTADYLTSKPFYLGNYTAADNVYLSFFYQSKGFGDKPEASDSLILEFKNNLEQWVKITSIQGIPSSSPSDSVPTFQQQSFKIDDPQFLFDGFQFRFRNIASLTGSVDHWHLDYVRVTENSIPSFELNDVAFTRRPRPFLQDYTTMPWRHFKDFKTQEMSDSYTLQLYNHFNAQKNINPSFVIIQEKTSGSILLQDNILSFNAAPIPFGNMPSAQHLTVDTTYTATQFATLINGLNNFDNLTEDQTFETRFLVNPTGQDGTVPLTLYNDTVLVETRFRDYFAYDDGEAELSIVGGRLGDQVAVQFHTNVPDTLRAVQLFIPHVSGDVTGQRFNLKIWLNDLNSTPVFQADFMRPIYVDSLTGWTTYSLDTAAVALPVGIFYVGWQQATDPPNPNRAIPVGYDRSNPDKAQFNFMNIGNGWQPLNSTTATIYDGAILLRPLVGDNAPFTTSVKKTPSALQSRIRIFPNPVQQQLFVQLPDENFEKYRFFITNAVGQILAQGNLTNAIEVERLSNGIYFLQITDTSNYQNFVFKFIKN